MRTDRVVTRMSSDRVAKRPVVNRMTDRRLSKALPSLAVGKNEAANVLATCLSKQTTSLWRGTATLNMRTETVAISPRQPTNLSNFHAKKKQKKNMLHADKVSISRNRNITNKKWRNKCPMRILCVRVHAENRRECLATFATDKHTWIKTPQSLKPVQNINKIRCQILDNLQTFCTHTVSDCIQ